MSPILLLVLACASSTRDDDDDDLGGSGSHAEADVIIVIDNSPSMVEEAEALGWSLLYLADTLAGEDVQVGMTTTSVESDGGATTGVDPGEAGLLLGGIVDLAGDGAGELLLAQLYCDATAWSAIEVPNDPSYVCGDDPGGVASQEYLDCLCGAGAWDNEAGSGQEEPLEAALQAMCRGTSMTGACLDPMGGLTAEDADTNGALVRAGVPTFVVTVSDEGDNSRRLAQGEEDPGPYLDAYGGLAEDLAFYVMGPAYDPDTESVGCQTIPVATWGVQRMWAVAEATGGESSPIAVGEDCHVPQGVAFMDALALAITGG